LRSAGYETSRIDDGQAVARRASPVVRQAVSAVADRLDVLVHSHDIQGLGHVSRGAAILAALKRIRPQSRVLLATGSPFSPSLELSGIDWIKLPAYGSVVVDGRMEPQSGPAGISLEVTRDLRSRLLTELVSRLRPRIVLVDHRPKGQHDELLDVMAATREIETRWILGMRAVVGSVEGVWTADARDVYARYYGDLFWYGDRRIVGDEAVDDLARHFRVTPTELGYVSLAELLSSAGVLGVPETESGSASAGRAATAVGGVGILSITWFSRESLTFLEHCAAVLRSEVPGVVHWHCFLGAGESGERKRHAIELLRGAGATVHPIAQPRAYLSLLRTARVAVIYAGYNSLLDAVWARVPTLAVTRQLVNREQVTHAGLIARHVDGLSILEERSVTPERLTERLRGLSGQVVRTNGLVLDGAQRAAAALAGMLDP
jgi:predicted glycosyltransferase